EPGSLVEWRRFVRADTRDIAHVPIGDHIVLATFHEELGRTFAHRRWQPDTRLAIDLARDHDACLHEVLEVVKEWRRVVWLAAHILDRLKHRAPLEDGETPQQAPLAIGQERKAPVDRCTDRALPRRPVRIALREKIQGSV